jgi:phage terminase small subunit
VAKEAKLPTRESIKRQTIKDMRSLGTYKIQYNRLIDIYSELCEQYAMFSQNFKDNNYEYEVDTMQGGSKKAPIVATLETLRKDILAYSDRLCLNPKSLETVTAESGSKSKLAAVLSGLK